MLRIFRTGYVPSCHTFNSGAQRRGLGSCIHVQKKQDDHESFPARCRPRGSSCMPGSKSRRWWVKMAWGIINIAIHNAYIEHRLQCEAIRPEPKTPMTNFAFRLALAKQLANGYQANVHPAASNMVDRPLLVSGKPVRPCTAGPCYPDSAKRKCTMGMQWLSPCGPTSPMSTRRLMSMYGICPCTPWVTCYFPPHHCVSPCRAASAHKIFNGPSFKGYAPGVSL